MNSKIGRKLLTSYLIIVVLTLIIAGALLSPLFKNYLIAMKKDELLRQSKEIISLLQRTRINQIDETTLNHVLAAVEIFNETSFIIIDSQGGILAPVQGRIMPGRRLIFVQGTRLSREEVGQVLQGQTVVKVGMSPYFNTPMISVAMPIMTASQGQTEVTGAVLSYAPVRLVTDILNKAYYYLVISSVIAFLLATLIALYFSKKIAHPLKYMNEAALAMAQGDYKRVITADSDDELGELAKSMNYLASQLDQNVTALQQEKGKLESTVLSINEGLVAVDQQGKIILVNAVMEKIFLDTTKNILGCQLQEISPLPELAQAFAESLSGGESVVKVFTLVHSTFKIVVSPIKQENGVLLGAVGIIQDISEMERVEQLRRDFIANVSHELRAPITVIRGYVDCLLDGVTQEPPEYYYRIIRDETLRLERLIKDIMDLSLLQAGKIELNLEEVDLNSLVHETVKKYALKASAKDITLLTNTGENKEIIVYCDADLIEQLIIIFMDNAFKFTPQGGTVEIRLEEKGEQVSLSFRDTGIGIPEKELPLIWERFYKVDKSRSRQSSENGTGLGLFIAKQIADLHQAELQVESELGKGSTFTLLIKRGIQ